MTYTLTAHPTTIVRDLDQAFIPTDPANIDYQKFLAWLDAGNAPTPHTPPGAAPAEAPQEPLPAPIPWVLPVASPPAPDPEPPPPPVRGGLTGI